MTSSARFAITPAGRRDMQDVAALAAGALREAWSAAGFSEMLALPGTVCLLARDADGDEPVGFLLAQRVVDELHILSLAVTAPWRRCGVARALVARALGTPLAQSVLLEVRPSNQGARAFYRTLGFDEVGCRKAYYPDGEDALLLTRGSGRRGVAKAGRGRG